MAFDTPLEADRPGELNLLNALVRAPVVGTLMWIFGGDAARAEEAQLQDCSATITTAGSRCASSSSVQNSRLEYEDTLHDWPDMDTEMNMDGNGHHNHNKLRRGQRDKAGAASATAALAHIQQTTLDPHINDNADDKARRQMSWSDESGQSLVEYFDENVKVRMWYLGICAHDAFSLHVMAGSFRFLMNHHSIQSNKLHIAEEYSIAQ